LSVADGEAENLAAWPCLNATHWCWSITAQTAAEVLDFAQHVQRDVFNEFAIQLAIEPDVLV